MHGYDRSIPYMHRRPILFPRVLLILSLTLVTGAFAWFTNTPAAAQTNCYTLERGVTPTGAGNIYVWTAPNCSNGVQYLYGTTVTISATPYYGYTFAYWSGDAYGTSSTTTVTMYGHRTVIAHFSYNQTCYTLATYASPYGSGSVALSPSPNCPNSGQYLPGTRVQMTAYGAPGYTFAGWSGNASGTANPYTIIMDSNKSVTANFNQPCYTLNYAVSPVNSGAVTFSPAPNCANGTQYRSGTIVKMTATGAPGFTFANWSGGATGKVNPYNLIIDGNKSVTANFTQTCFPLTYSASPAAGGTISANLPPNCANGTLYQLGTTVRLTANPNPSYVFVNWSGSASGNANPLDITINGPKSVVANFEIPAPAISWVSPDLVLAGGPAFTLSVAGTNFAPDASVRWNDIPLETQWLSSQLLEATVPASNITTSGIVGWVNVYNPSTGLVSPSVGVAVTNINPAPVLQSAVPPFLPLLSQTADIRLMGRDFTTGAKVYWNGAPLTTTFIKSTTLQVAVPGHLLTQIATVQLVVVNPAPGGGTSAVLPFGIMRPVYLAVIYK